MPKDMLFLQTRHGNLKWKTLFHLLKPPIRKKLLRTPSPIWNGLSPWTVWFVEMLVSVKQKSLYALPLRPSKMECKLQYWYRPHCWLHNTAILSLIALPVIPYELKFSRAFSLMPKQTKSSRDLRAAKLIVSSELIACYRTASSSRTSDCSSWTRNSASAYNTKKQ